METIEIDGKKYKLVPVEEETHSVLEGYSLKPDAVPNEDRFNQEVQDAVPKISDYRERYKQKKVKFNEISVPPKIVEVEDKSESLLDGYSYKGENLFFGEGLKNDIL